MWGRGGRREERGGRARNKDFTFPYVFIVKAKGDLIGQNSLVRKWAAISSSGGERS